MGLLLTLSYDGTNYSGWQQQKNEPTVASSLEVAFESIFEASFSLLGASRTDAGVHALGQRVHIICSKPCKIPTKRLPQVINSFLPKDIIVINAQNVPDNFHPINNTVSKTYQYNILNTKHKNPLLRNQVYHVSQNLNLKNMQQALPFFIGKHDFKAFCSSKTNVSTTIRTINFFDMQTKDDILQFTINGDGFLYNMVRIIVGTVINVGLNKLLPNDITQIITEKDRSKAGRTVPAHGLTLLDIFYDDF